MGKLVKSKKKASKPKKRTRPAKNSKVKKLASGKVALKKKSYCEQSFAPNLVNIEAPQLITSVKHQEISKKKYLVVQVIHPNTQAVLKEVRLPPKTDLNEAFNLGNSLKKELSKTTKTWVRGSEDDPTYDHSNSKKVK